MNNRDTFNKIFNFEKVDRMPIYFFGTWPETKVKWVEAGYDYKGSLKSHAGPQIKGMDNDWETAMWGSHGLFNINPISNLYKILEDHEDYYIFMNSTGSIEKQLKGMASINQTLEYGLKPTRDSWEEFKKLLDPNDKRRSPEDLDERIKKLEEKDLVRFFYGGSLYGWLRNWMGVENISYFMFDDPELLEEMVSYLTDFFITVTKKALSKVEMDVAYIFEDCCGASGPLFSPNIYKDIFSKYYKKLCAHYKEMGVNNILLDSDGDSDILIPYWLDDGVDIVFPLEVGTWENSPEKLRKKLNKKVKIFGGINKHIIPKGKDAIREHLLEIKDAVDEGGIIPIPDHRIPPDCKIDSMYEYIEVFNEVFNGGKDK